MDNYLIDRETLEQFVDNLMAEKFEGGEGSAELREQKIRELDDKIGAGIFEDLDEEQLDKVNELLDRGGSEEEFSRFFESEGIDLEEKIKNIMTDFKMEFLGGDNE